MIANMTLRPDGMWRSLNPVEIYRSQSFATAVYRSELAGEVQALGYRISVTAADGRWELQGYTREQVMAFSRRRQDIEALLNRRNSAGAAAAQIAAHQSRLAKEKRNENELRAEWKARAHDNRIALAEISERALARGPSQALSPAAIEEALSFSVAHNTEREAVTDRRALERTALQYAMGIADLDSVRRETGIRESRGDLIALAVSPSFPGVVYTTPEMVALERENLELMRFGKGRAQGITTEQRARSWAAGRSLSSEQAEAAALTLTATDWLTAIEGRAGAAKTTTVGALNDFAQSAGYAVRGFAPTTRAVKALSEAGIQSRTVASLLASPLPDRAPKELWVIDESSLLGTHQMNALLHKARESGAGRVVFVGDQRQHHAIEAGRPIQQMQQAGMPVARLETIRRQLDPGLREAVTLASRGEIGEAIALLERQGRIREIVDPNERHAAIAREYLAAHEAGEKVLVVSPANDERRQLNAAIRAALKEHGHISSDRTRTDRARKARVDPAAAQTRAELQGRRCAPIPAGKWAPRHRPRKLCPDRSNRSGTEPNGGARMKEERLSPTIPRAFPESRSSIRSAAFSARATGFNSAHQIVRSASPTESLRASSPSTIAKDACASTTGARSARQSIV